MFLYDTPNFTLSSLERFFQLADLTLLHAIIIIFLVTVTDFALRVDNTFSNAFDPLSETRKLTDSMLAVFDSCSISRKMPGDFAPVRVSLEATSAPFAMSVLTGVITGILFVSGFQILISSFLKYCFAYNLQFLRIGGTFISMHTFMVVADCGLSLVVIVAIGASSATLSFLRDYTEACADELAMRNPILFAMSDVDTDVVFGLQLWPLLSIMCVYLALYMIEMLTRVYLGFSKGQALLARATKPYLSGSWLAAPKDPLLLEYNLLREAKIEQMERDPYGTNPLFQPLLSGEYLDRDGNNFTIEASLTLDDLENEALRKAIVQTMVEASDMNRSGLQVPRAFVVGNNSMSNGSMGRMSVSAGGQPHTLNRSMRTQGQLKRMERQRDGQEQLEQQFRESQMRQQLFNNSRNNDYNNNNSSMAGSNAAVGAPGAPSPSVANNNNAGINANTAATNGDLMRRLGVASGTASVPISPSNGDGDITQSGQAWDPEEDQQHGHNAGGFRAMQPPAPSQPQPQPQPQQQYFVDANGNVVMAPPNMAAAQQQQQQQSPQSLSQSAATLSAMNGGNNLFNTNMNGLYSQPPTTHNDDGKDGGGKDGASESEGTSQSRSKRDKKDKKKKDKKDKKKRRGHRSDGEGGGVSDYFDDYDPATSASASAGNTNTNGLYDGSAPQQVFAYYDADGNLLGEGTTLEALDGQNYVIAEYDEDGNLVSTSGGEEGGGGAAAAMMGGGGGYYDDTTDGDAMSGGYVSSQSQQGGRKRRKHHRGGGDDVDEDAERRQRRRERKERKEGGRKPQRDDGVVESDAAASGGESGRRGGKKDKKKSKHRDRDDRGGGGDESDRRRDKSSRKSRTTPTTSGPTSPAIGSYGSYPIPAASSGQQSSRGDRSSAPFISTSSTTVMPPRALPAPRMDDDEDDEAPVGPPPATSRLTAAMW